LGVASLGFVALWEESLWALGFRALGFRALGFEASGFGDSGAGALVFATAAFAGAVRFGGGWAARIGVVRFWPVPTFKGLAFSGAATSSCAAASGLAEVWSDVMPEARLAAARLTRDLVLDAAMRVVLADFMGLRGILPPWSVCGLPPALSYRRRSSHKSADLNRRHA
jgi:hypothetical protein